MHPDHAHSFVRSLGLAILCLAASESATAQFILKPSTARHFNANSFVSGSAEIGARFGFSLAVGDFNNDGFDDLAVGVPYQPYQGDTNNLAGAVIVAYGAWDGLGDDDALPVPGIILYGGIAGPAQHLARFGWALAAGDFDNDGYDDLAVGAPGYDISGNAEGAVYTFHGGGVGLSTSADIRWSEAVLVGVLNDSEQFGTSLVAGDLNDDGRDDLAIGIPWDMISGAAQGSVAVLYANAGGLATGGNQLWHQSSPGMPGAGESGDMFGWSLAIGDVNETSINDLLIGSPGESVGQILQAGAATYLLGTTAGLATVDGTSVAGLILQDDFADPTEVSEADDQFGSTVFLAEGRIYVAALGEDGLHNEQGVLQAVETDYPNPDPTQASSPKRYGAPGGALGANGMAIGKLHATRYPNFLDTLIIGEPSFTNGRGAVHIASSGYGIADTLGVTYFSTAFGLTSQEGSHFGKSVAVGNFNGRGVSEIVIGAPLWDHCIPFNPPLCLADRGQITVVDDTLFADGYE